MSISSHEPIEIRQSEEFYHSPPRENYQLGSRGISKILTTDTHVSFGDYVFERHDFNKAFEGYLNPGGAPAPSRKFANPVPLGLASFCLTVFVLSLVNLNIRGVSNPAGLVGLFWFYAGIIELLAGMWCIVVEQVWPAVLLSSFGGFWLGYGCIVIDVFGISEIYGKDTSDMLALWLLGWVFFATMMWILTFKSTWPLFAMMTSVVTCYICLCTAQFTAKNHAGISSGFTKAGGVAGIIVSAIGWFIMYEGLATPENSYWVPPVFLMPGAAVDRSKEE